MDENRQTEELVSKTVFSDVVGHDRWIIRRLIWALIVAVVLLFTTNAIWIYFWNQYDYSSETLTTTADSDGDGMAINITGGNGGVTNYGQSDSNKTNHDQNTAFGNSQDNSSENTNEEEVTQPG